MDDFVGIASKFRIRRPWARLGSLFRISIADQRIEIWKDRSRKQKGIVLVTQIGFVCRLVPQQSDHQIGGVAGARIEKCPMLRQLLIRSMPRTKERGELH